LRWFLLVIVLLLSYCARKTVEIDLSRINLQEVLTRVKETNEGARSIKGLAYVTIKTPDRSVSFKQVTIAEESNLLHLEAIAPFGKTAGMVISDGEKTYVILPEEKRVFNNREEFDLSYLHPDLPLKLTINNLVNLLLGRLPEGPINEDGEVQPSTNSNYLVLTFLNNGKVERVLWVNPVNYRIEKAEINLHGGVKATCEFEDFMELGSGASFPKKIKLKLDRIWISVNYDEEVEINGVLDKNLFKPAKPIAIIEKKHQNFIIYDQKEHSFLKLLGLSANYKSWVPD
jgi:outer membrane lipoprotein-sorting protein